MTKKIVYTLLAIILLSIVFTGCSARYSSNQILFGIESAQIQLWDEAIFRWNKVVSEEPDSSAAYNNLAVAYEKKGMWEEAEKAYLTALKLDPKNQRIQSNYEKFKQDRRPKSDAEKEEESQDKKDKKNE